MGYSTLVIDGPSLFGAGESIAEREGVERVNFDYSKLRDLLSEKANDKKWRKSNSKKGTFGQVFDQVIAMVSIDPNSDAQGRFATALERIGYEIDRVNFREVFVSLPPGRFPPTATERAAGDRTRGLVSVAPRIAYLAGLLSTHKDSQLMVVSHAYELFMPLYDLASRINATGGHVGLAYFGMLLDHRYRKTGIIERGNADGVEFFDLDPHISALTSGAIKSENSITASETVFSKFRV